MKFTGAVSLAESWPVRFVAAAMLLSAVFAALWLAGPDSGSLRATAFGQQVSCSTRPPTSGVIADLRVVGPPVEGETVIVDASSAKVMTTTGCKTWSAPLNLPFEWKILQSSVQPPPGAFTGTLSLRPKLKVFDSNPIVVELVVCPGTIACAVPGWPSVVATEFDVEIDNVKVPPAQSNPNLPLFASMPDPNTNNWYKPDNQQPDSNQRPDVETPCGGIQPGIDAPEWVAGYKWLGAESYQLLEGSVSETNLAGRDLPFTHNQNDFNIHVVPDREYRRELHRDDQGNVGDHNSGTIVVEAERGWFDQSVWPTIVGAGGLQPNDRVSVLGYYVHDCGEGQFTEIHPPVAIAVDRARPIQVPSAAKPASPSSSGTTFDFEGTCNFPPCLGTVGNDVYVPGIASDVWVNSDGGGILDCRHSGNNTITLANFGPHSDCIQGPSPLNTFFSFNIYLPKSPTQVFKEAGVDDFPTVPLYYEALPGAGPDPVITQHTDGDATYLQVAIDLHGVSGTYKRRIVAGWVYASPDNWGAKSWRVTFTHLTVLDDLDADFLLWQNLGDWVFSIGLNNGGQERTPIFDCPGDGVVQATDCVDDGESPDAIKSSLVGALPWRTGPGEKLGQDIILFPGEKIAVTGGGIEYDLYGADNDNLPTFIDARDQKAGSYAPHPGTVPRTCVINRRVGTTQKFKLYKYDCSTLGPYQLSYQIDEVALPQPALSLYASHLYYFAGSKTTPNLVFAPEVTEPATNPLMMYLPPDSTPVSEEALAPLAPQECDFILCEDGPTVAQAMRSVESSDPQGTSAFLGLLSQTMDKGRARSPQEALSSLPQTLAAFKDGLSAATYDRFLGGQDMFERADVNCDGVIDANDVVTTLRFVAGSPDSQRCAPVGEPLDGELFGDTYCDGAVDAVDALVDLKLIAGLPDYSSLHSADCPKVLPIESGTPTPVTTPSPTPTPTVTVTPTPTPAATTPAATTPVATPANLADLQALINITPAVTFSDLPSCGTDVCAIVGTPFTVTLSAAVRNNGPASPVNANATFVLFIDVGQTGVGANCQKTAVGGEVQNINVGQSDLPVSESWHVTCNSISGPNAFKFIGTMTVDLSEAGKSDPNIGNNVTFPLPSNYIQVRAPIP